MMQDDCKNGFQLWPDKFYTLPEGAVKAGTRATYESFCSESGGEGDYEDLQNHPAALALWRNVSQACLQAAVPVLMGEVRRLESAVRLAGRWFQLNLGAEEKPLEADLRGMLEAMKEALSAPGDAGEGRSSKHFNNQQRPEVAEREV